MYDASLDDTGFSAKISASALDASVQKAADALSKLQRSDGHFVFELEADATIPAEYVLLRHFLGEPDDLELERKIGAYLRRIQGDHGGWPLYHGGQFDISATVKAYYALKMIGDSVDAPHMVRARREVLARGGARATNVFTRIQLALYGMGDWIDVPTMPAELILLPRWFPIHLSKMSYWARTVIVPLLVLMSRKPLARNPRGVRIDELYLPTKRAKWVSNNADPKWLWTVLFNALDGVLKAVEPFWPKALHDRAIAGCVDFVVERLNGEDGLGAIYPAMANSVMMFDALGYAEDHPHRAIARKSIENLLVIKDDEAYCQPCVSPIWDTGLAGHAMAEAAYGTTLPAEPVQAASAWLAERQILDVKGDWAVRRPDVEPGGWAFQYNNAHYPDVDDTAVIGMLLHRNGDPAHQHAIDRARDWIVGMQSSDGGWGAFEPENTHFYLNHIPFADHGALLDPPTADVTARCVSFLAQIGMQATDPVMQKALAYLKREQESDGSWFGRWGTNYIYGTWSVLCALNAAGVPPDDPAVSRACDWLISVQRDDGGWGEDEETYAHATPGTYTESTPSQTAWALLALMSGGRADDPAVALGIAWLQSAQKENGEWDELPYTAVGFPRVFYLRYHGYKQFFPLLAMSRFRNLRRSNDKKVGFGI